MTPRERNTITALMRTLDEADGEPMEMAVLLVWMERYVRAPALTRHELEAALRVAEKSGWVKGTADALGSDTLWVITTKGRLRE